MKLQQLLENIIIQKLRPYTKSELKNEFGEVNDSPYPDKIKKLIKHAIQNLNNEFNNSVEYIDVSDVENTEANLDKEEIEKSYKDEPEYLKTLSSLSVSSSFPPPIVVKYNNTKRLLDGNRRAIVLAKQSKKISVFYIEV